MAEFRVGSGGSVGREGRRVGVVHVDGTWGGVNVWKIRRWSWFENVLRVARSEAW